MSAPRPARPRSTPPPNQLFASCAPGLEPLLLGEIKALGHDGRAVPGGVEVRGGVEIAARLNLWLRTASRVLLRLGEFHATSFSELEMRARDLPFAALVKPKAAVAWRVTCKKSKLYHSDAVAERLHLALERATGKPSAQLKPSEDDATAPAQQLFARFERDLCTVSIDTTGPLLHLRGTRPFVSQGPLRETLAAALLLHAGYTGGPLLDPLCGAGTIPLEAALIARRRAPGLSRRFALLDWPSFDQKAFEALVAAARAQELPPSASIEGSDLDPRALEAARKNAVQAHLPELTFSVRALAALPGAVGPGLVATNPPYGQRVEARGADASGNDARVLVAEFERRVRELRPGNTLALTRPSPPPAARPPPPAARPPGGTGRACRARGGAGSSCRAAPARSPRPR